MPAGRDLAFDRLAGLEVGDELTVESKSDPVAVAEVAGGVRSRISRVAGGR
ncbi:MAG: hypothetical protein M5U09_09325 [Gammaproteobacteria bacterium]|nr:hypothetical protein [Gammaproteobacteria bacterium]